MCRIDPTTYMNDGVRQLGPLKTTVTESACVGAYSLDMEVFAHPAALGGSHFRGGSSGN